MNRKKYIIIAVSIVLVSLLVLIGTTYAVLTMTIEGDKTITLRAGVFKVDFAEGNTINLDNAAPVSDSKGQSTTPYTFTITNTGNLTAYYHVLMEEDSANTLANSYLKMRITGDNGYDSGVVKVSSYGTGTFEIISENELAVGEDVTYQLWMWLDENADNSAQGKIYQSKIIVESFDRSQPVPTAVETLLAKVNSEDSDYNNATDSQKKEMWTFSHPATDQTEALTDYRYIGADPNNYVTFNDEIWRIIGVFTVDDGTGKKEERVKIIRNESIGSYSWDNKDTTTGAEEFTGKNNWTDARLNYLLNEGHENEAVGGSLYWNSDSGNCYSGYYNATTTCDFTTIGLKEKAKNMIGNTVWYLGGVTSLNELASNFYSYERGTIVYSGRDISWTGKVGLIYPSDYGYATGGGITTDRESCINTELNDWPSDDCKNNNWIFQLSSQWTITHSTASSYGVLFLNTSNTLTIQGGIAASTMYGVSGGVSVMPVVFLKSNIKIVAGNGSSSNPYILEA